MVDPLEARLLPSEATRIGLIVPVSGVLGMVGPSAINCALLAAEELNAKGGILGRPVELVLVDGGRRPYEVAEEVAGLVAGGTVQALAGSVASDVRVAIVSAVRGRVPFVYAPPYEGGGHAKGVYFLGETPVRQLGPAIAWLAEHRRARRWFLLGNDYVWPRLVHSGVRKYLEQVVAELYVPYGRAAATIETIKSTRPDAILVTLIGSDLVEFNREFNASGLTTPRLCAALEEHGLMGIGGDDTGELYASMGYFHGLTTDAGLRFAERYTRAFGPSAPLLNAHGHGLYEAVAMLAALAARAGSLAVPDIDAHADGTSITSARGRLTLEDRHVRQRVLLGRADGLEFLLEKPFL
ncbi:substrate-binding domain-containing protein [Nonomuraea sp. NPDC050310]|uniref:substrate-binding domain-containing protein n=1 Tax=unclassified Nonomuraea TaxID=2593643 RepID=UPI0033EDEA05